MSEEDFPVSLQEVNAALAEIDRRYPTQKKSTTNRTFCFDDHLAVLSEEFDSLGLPLLDLSQPIMSIFKQVIDNSRALIQIHRNTLTHIKDINIDNQSQTISSLHLNKSIQDSKLEVQKLKKRQSLLENNLAVLTEKQDSTKRNEKMIKNEMERNKRYYTSKINESENTIRVISKENQRLKEMFSTDFSNDASRNDIVKKYIRSETIFKETVQKLEEVNKQLLEEIIILREQKLEGNSD